VSDAGARLPVQSRRASPLPSSQMEMPAVLPAGTPASARAAAPEAEALSGPRRSSVPQMIAPTAKIPAAHQNAVL
jgi:hypothetical protein